MAARLVSFSPCAVALVSACICLSISAAWAAPVKNGFDLGDATVPVDEIRQGGPPRDGIPSIDEPRFVLGSASKLSPSDRVLGVFVGGVAKAYPIGILNWHEIVNDRFGDQRIVVTFCPLCGTGMAFDARVAGRERTFGVSGLLYNSDVLLYDRESESLWSQIAKSAVSGTLKGEHLNPVVTTHTTWADWQRRYPGTVVLSENTGHVRDYGRDPYRGYESSRDVYFPVARTDPRYHPKERVIGLELNGQVKAYPFVELSQGSARLADRVGDQPVIVEFDAEQQTGRVLDQHGVELPTVIAFWFAWSAFHPQGEVYRSGS
jgi:hypothetical protein